MARKLFALALSAFTVLILTGFNGLVGSASAAVLSTANGNSTIVSAAFPSLPHVDEKLSSTNASYASWGVAWGWGVGARGNEEMRG